MPWGLHRYQECHHLHFITFSCYRRRQLLDPATRRLFERALERARMVYGFSVAGYVVMPEHIHMLVSEPERDLLSTAIQAIKQSVARRHGGRFWQERYYDFNVWSTRKRIEKLRYLHRNPVRRGLVTSADQWEWSSFRHYMTGQRGVVEIESEITAARRECTGIVPQLKMKETSPAKPKTGLTGAPSGAS